MIRSFLILCSAVAVTLASMAPVAAADADHGRALARKCSVCHGKTGLSNDPEVPNLAGQSAFYLEKSLKDYRSGAREDRRMTLLAKSMTDDEIKDLAAWFASISITVEVPG